MQVEQHCKNTKSEIVGYYQANQNINDNRYYWMIKKVRHYKLYKALSIILTISLILL